MSSQIGQVNEFNEEVEGWNEYVERMEQYFVVNDVKEPSKKRAHLLAFVGPKTYHLLKNLCVPQSPTDHTFVELCTLLAKYYKPKLSETVAILRFHKRHRKQGESVAQFLTVLKELTDHCQFETLVTRPQDQMLRDQLIIGINDSDIQAKLLALEHKDNTRVTSKEVFDLAVALETAKQNVSDMRGPVPVSVQAVQEYQAGPCWRCGARDHGPEVCNAKPRTCNSCKEVGHYSHMCPKFKSSYLYHHPWQPPSPSSTVFG